MDNSKEFLSMLDNAIRQQPNGFKNFDRTKNVQDQLQEMMYDDIINKPHYLLNQFYQDWYSKEYNVFLNWSMEQLWLAFVMHEKYHKIWNPEKEEWIKQEARDEKV